MPKPLMDLATFNARYFAGRVASGGGRYQELVRVLNKHETTMSSGGKNFQSVANNLSKILYMCGAILTASKQPPGSSKRLVVEELAQQAANEMKYSGRRMHMGLAINHDINATKAAHAGGVGQGYKGGANRLTRGDYTEKDTHDNNYWLEFYDPLHRPGFVLHKYWVKWLRDPDSSYAMSFWDWLAAREAADPAKAAKTNPTEQTLNPNAVTNRPLHVQYLNAIERQHYLKQRIASQLIDSSALAYDTEHERTAFSGNGWAIFVMDDANNLYAGSHIVGIFHHSSFLGGQATKAAGELICTNGKLAVITGKSGHYRPEAKEMVAALRALINDGVVDANAVCKPTFEGTDWYNATAYLMGNGVAPSLPRADVVRMIPPNAMKQAKVQNSLPPV